MSAISIDKYFFITYLAHTAYKKLRVLIFSTLSYVPIYIIYVFKIDTLKKFYYNMIIALTLFSIKNLKILKYYIFEF